MKIDLWKMPDVLVSFCTSARLVVCCYTALFIDVACYTWEYLHLHYLGDFCVGDSVLRAYLGSCSDCDRDS